MMVQVFIKLINCIHKVVQKVIKLDWNEAIVCPNAIYYEFTILWTTLWKFMDKIGSLVLFPIVN